MAQPTIELGRGFAFDSFALSEVFDAALKFGGVGRRSFKPRNEIQQLR